jgi:predicted methyltransferase
MVPAPEEQSAYEAVVASPLRAQDRAEDAQRLPVEFLRFARARPGMQVLDIWSGGGYTSELLALEVGATGHVWSQNDKPSKRLAERLLTAPQANLEPVIEAYDNPVPPGLPPLDLVTIVMSYHDIAALPVDRGQLDARLYAALKHGGHLVVIDHAARAGSGTSDSPRLHRIDEALVIEEFTRAGFRLEGQSDYLRHPEDPRSVAFFDMKTPSDKFALRFLKS